MELESDKAQLDQLVTPRSWVLTKGREYRREFREDHGKVRMDRYRTLARLAAAIGCASK
jgi:hypothetical protein